MIALARMVGIPCRYVSGYLCHGDEPARSEQLIERNAPSATHAWVEAFLPRLGWVGFDPTNDLVANDRHIRTALGRDYADVPPTHGVYRGKTESELSVAVHVESPKPRRPSTRRCQCRKTGRSWWSARMSHCRWLRRYCRSSRCSNSSQNKGGGPILIAGYGVAVECSGNQGNRAAITEVGPVFIQLQSKA